MSKRLRRALIGLTASLATLVALASVQPVSANLDCHELKACSGAAGCSGGGDPIGCNITCSGGGQITCDPASIE